MWVRIAVAAALAAFTFALYLPVADHGFLALDDRRVVVENPLVEEGLGADAVRRAFTTPYLGNWIPLTYVSLQIDRSLWGEDAGRTLLANAALHALATALCFLAFVAMTGETWPSAFVAAVFGLHPLHVESVAWASERKDVLSGVFFMLCLLAWWHYTRAPGALRYLGVALALGLGLLAKPMLVTLPLVLLLLDHWPLRRLGIGEDGPGPDPARLRRAVLEKLPLLALAAVASAVTMRSQSEEAAVYPTHVLTLDLRVANALASYASYLRDAFWPTSLGAFYPHPLDDFSVPAVAAGAALLVLVSALALRFLRERPWLAVGWLWYLGTLVPVIGLVQVGMQARADRYTYLPLVGVALMVAWTGAALARRLPAWLVGGAALAACGALAVGTARQIPHWRDSEAVFRRALEVTDADNWVAQQGLGFALLEKGEPAAAVAPFAEAVRVMPGHARPRVGLANALVRAGRPEEAIPHYERALALTPDDPVAQGNLGIVLSEAGRFEEAEPHLERALALHQGQGTDPSRTHRALAAVRAAQGRPGEALAHYEQALRGLPADVNVRAQAGLQAEAAGRPARAVAHYREALRLVPRFAAAANQLAWLLATCAEDDVRAPEEAVAVIDGAVEASADPDAAFLDTRAAAYAAAGRFEEAVRLADEALAAAAAAGRAELAAEVRAHRARFAGRKPLRRPCREGG